MAQMILTSGNDYYVSDLVPTGGETGNSILGLAGNDTIYGNGYNDVITGASGDDNLFGQGGNDILIGGTGDDQLQGGTGDDFLSGEGDNDILYGGTGEDTMYGGTGNDRYYYFKSDGSIDLINDDKSSAGVTGYGGGTDYVYFGDVVAADIVFFQSGNDMWVTDVNDVADGFFDTGMVLEDFFLAGGNFIERVYGSDNSYYDMTQFI